MRNKPPGQTMMVRLATVLLMSLTLTAMTVSAGPLLQPGEPFYEFAPGEVLVQFKGTVSYWDIRQACAEIAAEPVERSAQLGFWRVRLGKETDESEAVAFFRARADVEWANFNYIARACFTPNDTYYSLQWHLHRMNLPQAWDLTRGDPAVIVAVCDMGYQYNHQDWAGVQITSPYDFVQNDNNPQVTTFDSHGEHVAGTIIAATNNNLGIAGIAPLCTLMPIRVLDDSGRGTMSQISNGIVWAVNHSASVINLSIAIRVTGPPPDPGPPLSTAIAQAGTAGVIVCAATGNDYQGYVAYPAAYTQCIAVGATGWNDVIAPYSNRGTALDVVAPGGNMEQDLNSDGYGDGVLSTLRDASGDVYAFWQGTSMATPHVSGLAALLLSRGFMPQHVRSAIEQTAVDLGTPGWDATYGWGRVNAYAAMLWTGSDERDRALPQSVRLGEPYPNPFNSTMTISLELSVPLQAEVSVFNLLGERVTTLLRDQELAAGSHVLRWDARDAATGLYVVTLTSGSQTQTRKVLLLR